MKPKQRSASSAMASPPAAGRLARGRTREEATFPAPPPIAGLPTDYGSTLEAIKQHLRQSRVRAVLAANPVVIEAYWAIGHIILARQEQATWGAKVIDRLASDLQFAFPDMGGLSPRNLLAMKIFAREFPSGPICATACCAIALGPYPRNHAAAQRPHRPRLLHPSLP
jgi:hypothetical protein